MTDPIASGQLFVEHCIAGGLDYIIMDHEHGHHSDAEVAAVCAAGRALDFCVFIRVVDPTNYAGACVPAATQAKSAQSCE